MTYTVTDEEDETTYQGNATVTIAHGGGAATIRNWNWWGDPTPPSLVAADVTWAYPAPAMGDPNLSNRVILPVLTSDGRIGAMLSSKEINICSYARGGRKAGSSYSVNGTSRNEIHFYMRSNMDNDCDGMVTMDKYGRAIVSIGNGADELAHFVFYNSWLTEKKERPLSTQFTYIIDSWDFRNRPAEEEFDEAWPYSWGVQPYIAVYSQTEDGELYVAGTVTPGGAYTYFQYDDEGRIEALVRMNSVDPIACLEEKRQDVNRDCRVDMKDFALMAATWMECDLEVQAACW
jgi:hypothetical protein